MSTYLGNPYLPFFLANAENISKAILKDHIQSLDLAKDRDLRILFDEFVKALSLNGGKVSGVSLSTPKGVSNQNARYFAEAIVVSQIASEVQIIGDSFLFK